MTDQLCVCVCVPVSLSSLSELIFIFSLFCLDLLTVRRCRMLAKILEQQQQQQPFSISISISLHFFPYLLANLFRLAAVDSLSFSPF